MKPLSAIYVLVFNNYKIDLVVMLEEDGWSKYVIENDFEMLKIQDLREDHNVEKI